MAVVTERPTNALPSGAPSDAALTRRALRDSRAFRPLYDRYRGEIHAFLHRLTGERALAEDLVQEAFFRAYAGLERYDPARPFRPWLYQIARNAALDALRTRRKEKRVEGESARRVRPPDPEGVVPEAARREEVARLQAALDTLPAETRALLIQRHGLCMKLTNLAESFSCTERTVRNRLKAAAAHLSRALIGDDDRGGRP